MIRSSYSVRNRSATWLGHVAIGAMAGEEGWTAPDLFAEEEGEATWARVELLDGAPHVELQPSVAAVWGSSRNLASYLTRHPELVRGQRVVELGAGAGLPSLVAARLGASHVVTTDVDRYSVEAMERAVAHNGLSSNVVAARLDWAAPEACAAVASQSWPVVLAADCNYTSKAVGPLLRTIDALMSRSGLLLLASRERRIGLEDCLARCASEAPDGLGLQLEAVVTFSESGDTWLEEKVANWKLAPADDEHDDAAARHQPGARGMRSDAGAAPTTDAAEPEGGAAHRLWIFRRPGERQ